MAFPTVVTRNTNVGTGNVPSFAVSVPGHASRAAGDIAVICVTMDGTAAFSGTFPPAGYTLGDNQLAGALGRVAWFWRRLTGDGNDAATVNVTVASGENFVSRGWLLRGANPLLAPVSTTVTGTTGTAANLPALDPATWGTEDTVWLAYVGLDGNSSATAFPANYANTGTNVTTDATTANRVAQGYGDRSLRAASEDPGAFTITNGADFRGYLIAVPGITTQTGTVSGSLPVASSASSGGGAITFLGSEISKHTPETPATSITVAVPAFVQNGDYLLMVSIVGYEDTPTTPSGWTLVAGPQQTQETGGSTPEISVYGRVASSEPASYVVGGSSIATRLAAIYAFSGVSSSTPMDATPTATVGVADGLPDPPSITTVTNGAMVLTIGLMDADFTPLLGAPTGYTLIESDNAVSSNSPPADQNSNGARFSIASLIKTTAGIENPPAFTTTSAEQWGAITLALRPSQSVGGTGTNTPPVVTRDGAAALTSPKAATATSTATARRSGTETLQAPSAQTATSAGTARKTGAQSAQVPSAQTAASSGSARRLATQTVQAPAAQSSAGTASARKSATTSNQAPVGTTAAGSGTSIRAGSYSTQSTAAQTSASSGASTRSGACTVTAPAATSVGAGTNVNLRSGAVTLTLTKAQSLAGASSSTHAGSVGISSSKAASSTSTAASVRTGSTTAVSSKGASTTSAGTSARIGSTEATLPKAASAASTGSSARIGAASVASVKATSAGSGVSSFSGSTSVTLAAAISTGSGSAVRLTAASIQLPRAASSNGAGTNLELSSGAFVIGAPVATDSGSGQSRRSGQTATLPGIATSSGLASAARSSQASINATVATSTGSATSRLTGSSATTAPPATSFGSGTSVRSGAALWSLPMASSVGAGSAGSKSSSATVVLPKAASSQSTATARKMSPFPITAGVATSQGTASSVKAGAVSASAALATSTGTGMSTEAIGVNLTVVSSVAVSTGTGTSVKTGSATASAPLAISQGVASCARVSSAVATIAKASSTGVGSSRLAGQAIATGPKATSVGAGTAFRGAVLVLRQPAAHTFISHESAFDLQLPVALSEGTGASVGGIFPSSVIRQDELEVEVVRPEFSVTLTVPVFDVKIQTHRRT